MRLSLLLLINAGLLSAATDLNAIKDLKYRNIGPFRGGRVDTVVGLASQPNVYYFGATGGGVWKTTDGGTSWEPLGDGQFKTGSVGSLAVAESDPNTIYAGMGEPDIRGNASPGDGVYKSVDAGKTWKRMGLDDTQQIGAVRVHPRNPDIVYVAALGHQFGPNEQRGVFRSSDGGKNWKQVLTRGPKAGAVDLAIDPGNANVLYAAFWEVYRTPWSLESGGPGSGLWKSIDGGDTWTDLSRNPGMPKGIMGRIGVTVSAVNPERVWAIVEAEDGGLFRSEDAGKTWTRVNSEAKLRQRAWYYSRIFADPQKANTIYAVNVGFFRSDDAGKTFQAIRTPHGDNHYLWIAPNDSNRMIESNDGGANVTVDGGRSWTSEDQQPTAQFYRVALDNDFPYHAYGAQQDNSTVKIATRGAAAGIGEKDWYPVGGGESGWLAPDPRNSEIVYAGSYDGLLTRYDHRTGQLRNVTVWPDNPMGYGAEGMKYRFQWNFPIFFSPHDPKTLYAGGNVLFKTTNEGQSWQAISGDLTRNDRSKQAPSGGLITKDNSGVEYYCTIFTAAESPLRKGVIWVGSDDGLVHVTQDGKTWTNVTPKGLPEWTRINSIEASPIDAATAYVAATRYQQDDFAPMLYKTTDYGKSWTTIVSGIPPRAFTRVIREDPNRKDLLVAGTETGLYVSFNGGAAWQSMQLNLPIVPVTDLAFHKREKELVVATQGRAFWILDDLPLLYQVADGSALGEGAHLFQPKDAYRLPGGGFRLPGRAALGANPPSGAVIYYSFKEKPKGEVTLEFLDNAGKLVKKFSSKEPEKKGDTAAEVPEEEDEGPPVRPGSDRAPANVGLNRFVWDLRYADATKFPRMIFWAGGVRGPVIAPGKYQVRLTADGKALTQSFEVKKDPRLEATPDDYARQLELALQIRDKLSATNEGVIQIRDVRKQIDELSARVQDQKVQEAAKALAKKLSEVEQALYQTKNQANEDPLNYPIRLNNKLAALEAVVESADAAPTVQSSQVYEDLASQVNAELKKLQQLLHSDLAAFNKLVRDQNVPAVLVK